MKKLLLLCFLALSLTSCGSAQQIEPRPVYVVNAYVHTVYGELTTLQPSNPDISYEVSTRPDLVVDKEYTFFLEYVEVGTRKIKAVIVGVALTTLQAQRDQEAEAERLSERTIIRKSS